MWRESSEWNFRKRGRHIFSQRFNQSPYMSTKAIYSIIILRLMMCCILWIGNKFYTKYALHFSNEAYQQCFILKTAWTQIQHFDEKMCTSYCKWKQNETECFYCSYFCSFFHWDKYINSPFHLQSFRTISHSIVWFLLMFIAFL